MAVRLGRVTLLVRNIDRALDFYTRVFGFRVLIDQFLADGFRAVHLGTGDLEDPGIWLMPTGSMLVGQQTAGAPALVFYTDDLAQELARLASVGVHPEEPAVWDPETEQGHARVQDLYGNEIVIAQLGAGGRGRGAPDAADHRAVSPQDLARAS